MLLDLFKLAILRVKNRLLESIIVILSLGFGLAIVSTVISMMVTFNSEFVDINDSPFKRNIEVLPIEWGMDEMTAVQKIGTLDALDRVYFTQADIDLFKESCPSIKYAIIDEWVELVPDSYELSPDESINWWEVSPAARGINHDYFNFHNIDIEEGSLFSEDDYTNGNNVIILGGNIKTLLFQDKNPVGEVVTYDNTDYRIIGYIKETYETTSKQEIEGMRSNRWTDQNMLYIPYTTKSWRDDSSRFDSFSLGVESGLELEKGLEEVNLFLSMEYPGGSVHSVSYLDWGNDTKNTTNRILKVIAFIAMVSLLIAALTNLNLMLARVLRDKKGFGISQALGATKKILFVNTLMESLFIGFLGTILGLILMVLFTFFVGEILGASGSVALISLNINNFLINLALAIFVTGLFSIFPAIEASKIQPSKVLRED